MYGRSIMVGVAGSLFIASIASANFDSFTWSLSNNALAGSGLFTNPGSYAVGGAAAGGGSGTLTSTTMTVVGGNASVRGVTWYSTTATTAGTISVNWSFSNTPGGDSSGWDAGGWVLNGNFSVLALNSQSPTSGVLTFGVNAGDTFGFGTATADGAFGASTTVFTDFVPAPGAIGLLALAGLAGSRRRR